MAADDVDLRERLIHLCDELPDEVVSASWLRDGRERWMAELQLAREPSELAQCSLQLEKCIKRRAQPKWWRHERPIWVQGLLALSRSSQDGLAGCEPERLLQQLVLTLSKLVRTLDLSALGAFTPAVDAARKRAEEMREVIRADESGEVIHGDAPVVDFFLQRKRRRLQRGDPLLPPLALQRLHSLARQPTAEVLADVVLEGTAADDAGAFSASAWTRLLSSRLAIFHGGIGTLQCADAESPGGFGDDDRPVVVCAPDSMLLALDDATADVPGYMLRAVCQRALRSLAAAPGAELFEVPIEAAILSCPMPCYELRTRSRRLLDLPKVRARLEAAERGYESLAEFRQDMRDMFQNAIDYHGPRAPERGAALTVGGGIWIARVAAELHARLERVLPCIIEEMRPRLCSYLCPVDALPRPWAVLELTHAAHRVSSAGFLRDLPVTVIGEMRAACLGILQHVQREVAERLRDAPAACA